MSHDGLSPEAVHLLPLLCGCRRILQTQQVVIGATPAGPHVPWRAGRADKATGGELCAPDGRLPDASLGGPHIRGVFNRMGFNDQEIVALSGVYAMPL